MGTVLWLLLALLSPSPQGAAPAPSTPEHATSRSFNRALGVECSHCHTGTTYADESKPTFDFARRMEQMTRGLSDGPLQDLGGVTCWSCHRGHPTPVRLTEAQWRPIASAHASDFVGGRQGLDLAMSVYAASLGVDCAHCHLAGNWADGSRRAHQMVRRMGQMFTLIPTYFQGSTRQPVTQCYMCHHGSVHVERD